MDCPDIGGAKGIMNRTPFYRLMPTVSEGDPAGFSSGTI
jgi:hypothetical protein